jgi:tetratricopeptide (TPR) repeat protein
VFLGTPEYMSPEQAAGRASEVDTRADVHALGAIGFKLLTGELPYDISGLPLTDAMRRVAETDARRLSTVGGRFASDLETIVAKALARDRDRRYASASELATDIRRYLAGQPIQARPTSAFYQFRKLVARNPLATGLTAVVVVLLVASSLGIGLQARRIAAERDHAALESETATEVTKFLTDLFAVADPSEARGNSITVREMLDRGVERIDSLEGAPPLLGRLLTAMGTAYYRLGLADEGRALLLRAVENARMYVDEDPESLIAALELLAWTYRGRSDAEGGLAYVHEARALAERALGPDHERVASCGVTEGVLLRDAGDLEAAASLLEQAEAIGLANQGPKSRPAALARYHRGWLLHLRGDPEGAEALLSVACDRMDEVMGPFYTGTAWCFKDHAVVLSDLGRAQEAAARLARALAIQQKILPEDHPDLAATIDSLGTYHWQLGDFEAAEQAYRRALEMRERVLGGDHLDVARSLSNLGLALRRLARVEEATEVTERALGILQQHLPDDHPSVYNTTKAMAYLYRIQGDFHGCSEMRGRALAAAERQEPYHANSVFSNMISLTVCLLGEGRLQEAEKVCQRASGLVDEHFDGNPRYLVGVGFPRMLLLDLQERVGEADAAFQQLLGLLGAIPEEQLARIIRAAVIDAIDVGDDSRALDLLAIDIEIHRRLDPDGTLQHYAVAMEQALRGRREAALEALQKVVEIDPTSFIDPRQFPSLVGVPEFQRLLARPRQ